MLNAGTIAAYLTLDTNPFTAGMRSANAQLQAFGDENLTVAQKIQGVGGALTTIGGTLTKHLTLPLLGAGTAAVAVAAGFDAGMSRVQAISGATGDELDRLRDKAREMGAKTKFSASEAADAMSYMAMAGWKTGEMLDGIEGIMNLAAASGEDLATTSDIVTDALTAFGLKAKDSAHFSDILAAASSNANTNVSMMGESFKYCASIAGAMGYSAEDVAEALGIMANSGIKASQAGTALRSIMTKLNGDIKISGKELGEVTIKTANADGSMREFSDILGDCRKAFSKLTESERSANAETLAGKYAMSGFLSLMNAGEDDINKLSGAIAECDGAAGRMADTMQNNLQGRLTRLKSQTEEVAIAFGSELMPTAEALVRTASDAVGWFGSLDSGTRRLIVNAGLVAASLGPVLLIAGKLTAGVGSLITTVSGAAAAFTAFGGGAAGLAAALTSIITPAGWVVLGLAAVTAAGVALYASYRNATKGTRELGESMQGVKKYADEFKSGINSATVTTSEFASTLNAGFSLNDVKNKISNVQNKITAITSAASNARRDLTKKEIKQLQKYFDELKKLTDQELEYYTANLSGLQVAIDSGMEMTRENTQKILGEAKANKEAAVELAWQAYTDEMTCIAQTTKEGSEERQKQTEAAKAEYDRRLAVIRDSYAGITAAVSDAYMKQNLLDSDFYQKMRQHNAEVETENQRHDERMAEIQTYALSRPAQAAQDVQAELQEHNRIINELNQQMADSFDGSSQEIAGTMVALLGEMQACDGAMSAETVQFVTTFLACYDSLPEELRAKMGDTVVGMRQALDGGLPGVIAAADNLAQGTLNAIDTPLKEQTPVIGNNAVQNLAGGMKAKEPEAVGTTTGILNSMLKSAKSVDFSPAGEHVVSGFLSGLNARSGGLMARAREIAGGVAAVMRGALQINSPSKVMIPVGEAITEGMEVGLTRGSRHLYDTASAISLDTAEIMSSLSTAVPPAPAVADSRTDPAELLEKLLDAVERLADSQPTMEIDGRPFGRLVRAALPR